MRSFLGSMRRWLESIDPEMRGRRRDFEQLNEGASLGRTTLRKGVSFEIDEGSRASFEYFQFRSKEMCRELDAFLDIARDRRRLLDVGALHGVFSLAFTALGGARSALAVEPSQAARDVLVRNLDLNPGLEVAVSDRALGGDSGTVRMRPNWQHLEALPPGEVAQDAISVPLITADELCRSCGLVPDIVKIDVEGYEAEVLAGAAEVLSRKPVLLLELHPPRLGDFGVDPFDLLRVLEHAGYRVAHLSGFAGRPPRFLLRRRSAFRILATPR